MLTRYDHLEIVIQEHQSRQKAYEDKLIFLAGDILMDLEIDDPEEMTSALDRTFHACFALSIPFEQNFKRVYRFNGDELILDWKLSPLASYLLIINCNPSHAGVAKAQLFSK